MEHLDLFRRFGLRTTIAPSLQGVGPSRPGWFRALPLAASFILLTAPLRGEFAYVANVKSNTVSAYSVGSNGALTPVPGSPFATGHDPMSVTVVPTGWFAYVVNINDSTISAFSIGSNGALTPVPGSPFASRYSGGRGVHWQNGPHSVSVAPYAK